ncbi:MAG TPA: hypothetical protein VHB77_01355, partial [Planctomycetaceae bacterium]|nr:hypothetical protein [Planctomycetaceae bacterium]
MRFLAMAALMLCAAPAAAQTLQDQLAAEGAGSLARAARAEGDVQRGALLFHQPHLACVKCHLSADAAAGALRLGPDLAKLGKAATPEHLVESILDPSRVIARGFESVSAVTSEGKPLNGLLVENRNDTLVLRDPVDGKLQTFKKSDLDDVVIG